MTGAIFHLVKANPIPLKVSTQDYTYSIADKLLSMVEQHREEICRNLIQYPSHDWGDVVKYFPENMAGFVKWVVERRRTKQNKRTIGLCKKNRPAASTITLEETRAFVATTIEQFFKGETNPHILLVSHTGSGKSTQDIAQAIQFIKENPDKTVVILVPRHDLNDELIKLINAESGITAAVFRGRGAKNPHGSTKDERMCQRPEEAEAVQMKLLDVEQRLCERSRPGKGGRTENTIKCPFLRDGICAYQKQKDVKAHIWFGAHELLGHEMPEFFGDVGRVKARSTLSSMNPLNSNSIH